MAKARARGAGGRFVATPVSPYPPQVVAVPVPAAAAPRKRRSPAKKAAPKKRRGGGGRRRRSSSNFLGMAQGKPRTAIVLGSVALGFASQQGWLAKLPLIGNAGPITSFALLGWGAEEFAHIKLPPIVHDAVTSALAISAFNIGSTIGTPGGIKLVGDAGYGESTDGSGYVYHYPGGAAFYG